MDNERALWDAAEAGEGESFARIFDLHKDRVFRHALRLVDTTSDAEDTVATAFMELWRRREKVRVVNGSVLPWLLVTTTHITRNLQRSSRRYRALLVRLPRSEASPDASQDYLANSVDGLDPRLAAELRSLGWADQQLLTLVALEGYTMAETAAALGITLAAVKSRMHRLRRRFRPKQNNQTREASA